MVSSYMTKRKLVLFFLGSLVIIFFLAFYSYINLFSSAPKVGSCFAPTIEQMKEIKHCYKVFTNSKTHEKKFTLTEEARNKLMYFKKYNYDLVWINSTYGVFWANREGRMMKTLPADSLYGGFSQGLARHKGENGKIGYMNLNLRVVIKPQFDGATPFAYDYAKVCIGCKRQFKAKDLKEDQHINPLIGGKWWVIDKKGVKVKSCPLDKNERELCVIPAK